jgi:hypothetical protein
MFLLFRYHCFRKLLFGNSRNASAKHFHGGQAGCHRYRHWRRIVLPMPRYDFIKNTVKLLLFREFGIQIMQGTLKIWKLGSKDQRLRLAK